MAAGPSSESSSFLSDLLEGDNSAMQTEFFNYLRQKNSMDLETIDSSCINEDVLSKSPPVRLTNFMVVPTSSNLSAIAPSTSTSKKRKSKSSTTSTP